MTGRYGIHSAEWSGRCRWQGSCLDPRSEEPPL